jgi:hypothetical protein
LRSAQLITRKRAITQTITIAVHRPKPYVIMEYKIYHDIARNPPRLIFNTFPNEKKLAKINAMTP